MEITEFISDLFSLVSGSWLSLVAWVKTWAWKDFFELAAFVAGLIGVISFLENRYFHKPKIEVKFVPGGLDPVHNVSVVMVEKTPRKADELDIIMGRSGGFNYKSIQAQNHDDNKTYELNWWWYIELFNISRYDANKVRLILPNKSMEREMTPELDMNKPIMTLDKQRLLLHFSEYFKGTHAEAQRVMDDAPALMKEDWVLEYANDTGTKFYTIASATKKNGIVKTRCHYVGKLKKSYRDRIALG